jgi:hypothetical protein
MLLDTARIATRDTGWTCLWLASSAAFDVERLYGRSEIPEEPRRTHQPDRRPCWPIRRTGHGSSLVIPG